MKRRPHDYLKPRPAERPPLVVSFMRSHVASFSASVLDFAIFWVLFRELHVYYVTASVFGAIHGAVANFLLGRHWIFEATDDSVFAQGWRYLVIAAGSVTWNGLGIWLLTEELRFDETIAKIVTGLAVGIFWNFVMHRQFVFSRKEAPRRPRTPIRESHPEHNDD